MFDDMGGGLLYGEELLLGKFFDDFVESLFEPNGADSNYFNSSSEQPFVSLPPEIDEQCYLDYCYQNPKRRKTNYYSDDLHYYSMNNNTAFPQCPEIFYPKTEQQIQLLLPPMDYENSTTAKKKSSLGDSGLSAQSIAARRRRKKISDKTQELGKLIPGSNRMNSTADMFQAAYKYVQYLQAQVSILQLMGSKDNNVVPLVEEGFHVLLVSSTIQEKLYSEEKCLVPQDFVETVLPKDKKIIQSKPSISKDNHLQSQPRSSSETSM